VTILAENQNDVNATAIYAEPGKGPGIPAYEVDAFDATAGQFINDDFVASVEPDHDLAWQANDQGFVPTSMMEEIRAYADHFVDWKVWKDDESSVGNPDLVAPTQESAIAFAFFTSLIQMPVGDFKEYPIGTWVSWGVKVDAGGPTGHGPVPPWTPFVQKFAAGMALAEVADEISPELQQAVLDLATKQISLAADSISKEMLAAGSEGTIKLLHEQQATPDTLVEVAMRDQSASKSKRAQD
jgi:hypothetical protein